jgi:hypothetical protein
MTGSIVGRDERQTSSPHTRTRRRLAGSDSTDAVTNHVSGLGGNGAGGITGYREARWSGRPDQPR